MHIASLTTHTHTHKVQRPPLLAAVAHGKVEVVKVLCEEGADMACVDDVSQLFDLCLYTLTVV